MVGIERRHFLNFADYVFSSAGADEYWPKSRVIREWSKWGLYYTLCILRASSYPEFGLGFRLSSSTPVELVFRTGLWYRSDDVDIWFRT